MAFYPLVVPSVIAAGGGVGVFPPDLETGFLTRVQLINIAAITPPENPLLGEMWVDLTESTEPALKIWNGLQWILSTLSGTGFGFLALSDTPDEYAVSQHGNYLRVKDGGGIEFAPTTFLDLSDSPNSYAGREKNFIRVNSSATGIEFTSGDGLLTPWENIIFTDSSVLDIQDLPQSFTGSAGKALVVSPNEDGIEFTALPNFTGTETFVELTDTPDSLETHAGDILRVNAAESALQFATPSTIHALGLMIGELKQVAFAVPDDYLYTDPRTRLIYYNPKGGSIGKIGSQASTQRADFYDFYQMIWNQSYSSIEGGKFTASSDWANLKKLLIPDLRGRFLLAADQINQAGALGGQSQVIMTEAQIAPHNHVAVSAPHSHGVNQQPHGHSYMAQPLNSARGQQYAALNDSGPGNRDTGKTTIDLSIRDTISSVSVESAGQGAPIPIMPKFFSSSLLIFTGLSV